MDIRTSVINFLLKSQKAQYLVAKNQPNNEIGQPVPMQYSPDIRLKLYRTPIVFMAINAIADQISKVDWEIVPKRPVLDMFGYGTNEGKSSSVMTRKEWTKFTTKYTAQDRQDLSKETKEHIQKAYTLLENPNDNQENFMSILKKIAIDLKLHDAAAIEKVSNGVDEIVEIYTAPACYIQQNFDKNGKLLDPAYIQLDPQSSNTKVASWSKDELIYMMLNPISTSMYGVSPVDIIAQIVATLVNALNYNGTYFESAALPEGFFTIPGLTEESARRLMMKWEQEIKGKPHKIMFMPGDSKWNQFRFSNVEMQWLQGQKFYMEIVMAVLGVTKHELGFTEDVNRATADNQSFVFKNRSLLPILGLISSKFNQELLGKDGFGWDDVMFVFKNVDLADKETMDKIHDRAVKSGRMTINEAREERGDHPYKGFGDEPVIATSQGLVFLQQYQMQFEDYQEERKWLQDQAGKQKIPVNEAKRRLQQEAAGGQDGKGPTNATGRQPKTPPSAPKADQQPGVDESKSKKESQTVVAGLEKLTEKIEQVIGESHEQNSSARKSKKSSTRVSSEETK